jgi:hypothetical protein
VYDMLFTPGQSFGITLYILYVIQRGSVSLGKVDENLPIYTVTFQQIPGSHFSVNEIFALLGCYAAYSGS